MTILALGFAVYYFSLVLIYQLDSSGPFPSDKSEVVTKTEDGELHQRPVDFFDRIRYVFGLYMIIKDEDDQELWMPKEKRLPVWLCPICLSFWVSLFFAWVWLLADPSIENAFLNWFAAAGISTFLYKVTNR